MRGHLAGVLQPFAGMHEQLSPVYLHLARMREQLILRSGYLVGCSGVRNALERIVIRRTEQIIVTNLPRAGLSACGRPVEVQVTSVHVQIIELRRSLAGV